MKLYRQIVSKQDLNPNSVAATNYKGSRVTMDT
jgi:hypothetical protein